MRTTQPVIRYGLAVLAALVLGSIPSGAATKLHTIGISDPADGISEFRPRIHGGVVVWQRGSGAASEVMRREGKASIRVTANGVADENPETDGVHIVWQQGPVGQRNIAVFDLVTKTTTVLSTTADETLPMVSGPYLAWVQMVDPDGEVFITPGPFGGQLTGNSLVESDMQVDGSNFVWVEGDDLHLTPGTADDSHDIAVWNSDLQGLYILTGTGTDDIRPSIAGDTVVWQAGPDGAATIWYGDTLGTAAPLYEGTDDRDPDTDGSRVIWSHWDGLDFDLYTVNLASPGATVPFTNDTIDDVTPKIDGDNVVWVKKVTPGDSEIWFSWHNGPAEPLLRTRNNGRDDVDPQLEGDHFVYESCVNLGQPDELCDLVLVPEPLATGMVAAALATLAFLASRSARRAVELARISPRR